MKKFFCLLTTAFLAYLTPLTAQINTSSNFNFYDINATELLTPHGNYLNYFSGYDPEEVAYWNTTIQLAEASEAMYYAPTGPVQPDTVVGGYRIKRFYYMDTTLANQEIKLIMLRPNDDVDRPAILLTHGGRTSSGDALQMMTLGATDLVQRGYAVLYYQSSVDDSIGAALLQAGLPSVCSSTSIPTSKSCMEQSVYIKMLFGYAAAQYAVHESDTLHIDTTQMFLMGHSGGAVGSFNLALADESTNFQSSALFGNLGDFNRFSLFPTETFDIQAVVTLAGGVLDDAGAGPLVSAADSSIRFLMFHGQDDANVKPGKGAFLWAHPLGGIRSDAIGLVSSTALQDTFEQFGITSKVILNCSGCHTVVTYPCDNCDDCDGNATESFGEECYNWFVQDFLLSLTQPNTQGDEPRQLAFNLMQIHDICLLSAHFMHEDIPENAIPARPSALVDDLFRDGEIVAINPTIYPYDENNINGHYERSSKCLVQENAALLFNQNGDDADPNTLLSNTGDFLDIPWGSQGQTDVLANDFTIEMRFKVKNPSGRGTLFSYLDDSFLPRGMEIFINSAGEMKFQYRNSLQLTDTTNDMNDGICHHVAVTRSGDDYRLWVDGVMQEEKLNQGASVYTLPTSIYLGNTHQPLQNVGFNGIISEFRLWEAAINDCSMLNISVSPTTTDLFAHWIFDEGQAQTIDNRVTANPIAAVLGSDIDNGAYDPKWLTDDELCACDVTFYGNQDAGFASMVNPDCDRSLDFLSADPAGIHFWDFGDGTSAATPNPSHQFPVYGTYLVQHTQSGSCGNASDSRAYLIDSEYLAEFSISPTTFAITDTSNWIFSGAQFGEFLIDGNSQGIFDFDTLGSPFSQDLGIIHGSGAVTADGTVFQETQLDTLSPGLHQVCLVTFNPGNTCSDTLCIQIEITTTTAAPIAFSPLHQVKLYPNPSQEEVFLQFPSDLHGSTQFTLTDLQGKPISQSTTRLPRSAPDMAFDVSTLPSGVYFLTIRNAEQTITRKLMKR